MLPKYFFNGSREKVSDAFDYYRKGVPIFCSICKSKLDIALSNDEAITNSMPSPGIFCPNGHFSLKYIDEPFIKPTYIFDGTHGRIEEAVAFYKQGYSITCSVCEKQLFIALNREEANYKHMTSPGIYCGNAHISIKESELPVDVQN